VPPIRAIKRAIAIVEAQWAARDRALERYVTEQPPYSILTRGIEAEVLPTCASYGMGVIPYSPLGGGWLSGRRRRKGADMPTPASAARQRVVDRYDIRFPPTSASSKLRKRSPASPRRRACR
jgi:aryl-alcohol dehydrogenase-like predicted oxidoreductase